MCTISGNEELDDLVNSDLVKERKGTLRLKVIPKGERATLRPSILHRRDSSDHSGTSSSTLGAFFFLLLWMSRRKRRSNVVDGGVVACSPTLLRGFILTPPHPLHLSHLVGDSKTGRPVFDSGYTDSDMLEVLRDISLFICTRGMDRQGEQGNCTVTTHHTTTQTSRAPFQYLVTMGSKSLTSSPLPF